jgi:dipeptidase
MGAFFPVSFPEGPLPDGYKAGGDSYDPDSYFWQAERINRKALAKFEEARAFVRPLIEETERETLMKCGSQKGHCGQENVNKRFEAARRVRLALEGELAKIQPEKLPFFYRRYWNKYNRKNGVPVKV